MQHEVVIVEDDASLRRLLDAHLTQTGFQVESFDTIGALKRRLGRAAPDALLLDMQLPDGLGVDVLPAVAAAWPETPVLVITGHATVEGAVEAMHRGAYYYLPKPLSLPNVDVLLERALETRSLRQLVEATRRVEGGQYSLDRLKGPSQATRDLVAKAKRAARSSAGTILLRGESGTGKGLLARAIHATSPRRKRPFLTLTCSAIPEALLESELFGHERGSFTDAKERRVGIFEAARGGTVFLDEIGDMPLPLQGKLLGVLEDRSFRPLGSNRTVAVDVRVIAATHCDLEAKMAAGEFRTDLFYRLNIVPIQLPPLRERPDDIVPLTRAFIEDFNREFGRDIRDIEHAAAENLRRHPWPGNVRELRNAIERAVLFVDGSCLRAADLHLDAVPVKGGRAEPPPPPETPVVTDAAFRLPANGVNLEQLERRLVQEALRQAGGVKSRAAKLLGISRDQMRYRIRKLGQTRSG